jgi:hypothetical protein
MDNLHVESVKVYIQGFILKEQDFRKIVSLTNEQFQKEGINGIVWNFLVSFKNGVVAKTKDLNEVLILENEGQKQITSLKMEASGTKIQESDYTVSIDFSLLSNRYTNQPIQLIIKGLSRDWVFLTTSELDEKIKKLKRATWPPIGLRIGDFFTLIFFPLMAMSLFIFPSSPSTSAIDRYVKQMEGVNNIVKKYNVDSTYGQINLIVDLERNRLKEYIPEQSFVFKNFSLNTVIIFFALLLLFVLSLGVGSWFQIPYAFYWGEYMEVFDRREKIKNYVLSTVVAGGVISIVTNFIYEFIKS